MTDPSNRPRIPVAIWLLLAVRCLPELPHGLIAIAATQMMSDLGVGAPTIAFLVAVSGVSEAASGFLLPVISDRLGRRVVLTATVSAWVAGMVLFATAPTLGMLFAGRILAALGGRAVLGLTTAYGVEIAPERTKGRVIGFLSIQMFLGVAVLLPVFSVVTRYVGWRFAFGGLAGFGLLALAGGTLVWPSDRPDKPFRVLDVARDIGATVSLLRRGTIFIYVVLAAPLFNVVPALIGAVVGVYLGINHQLSPVGISAVMMVGGLLGVAASYAGGVASDRFRSEWLCAGASMGMGLVILGAWSSTSTWLAVGIFVLAYLFGALRYPAYVRISVELTSKRDRGKLMGLTQLSGGLGWFIGGSIASLILSTDPASGRLLNVHWAGLATFATTVVFAFTLFLLARARRRAPAVEHEQ